MKRQRLPKRKVGSLVPLDEMDDGPAPRVGDKILIEGQDGELSVYRVGKPVSPSKPLRLVRKGKRQPSR